MKRDMDLIRLLLLQLEVAGKARLSKRELNVEGYDEAQVAFHIDLMEEKGWLQCPKKTVATDRTGLGLASYIADPGYRPTMEGCDFLDSIRDPEVWQKTKTGASAAGSWTLGIFRDLATAYTKIKIQEVTGVAF